MDLRIFASGKREELRVYGISLAPQTTWFDPVDICFLLNWKKPRFNYMECNSSAFRPLAHTTWQGNSIRRKHIPFITRYVIEAPPIWLQSIPFANREYGDLQ
jgi:hypothetical protein